MFEITILGCGSATPSLKHMPSSQVVDHNGKYFMIDCGEGTQLEVRRRGIKTARLNNIFISHLHGDHILGLPGLLSSLSLNDFTGEMHVYMLPEGIDVIKQTLATFAHEPNYTLTFHPLTVENKVIYEDATMTVETFPLSHTVPAVGFLFKEKPKPRRIIGEMVEFHQVPLRERAALKDGADYVKEDGTVVPNRLLTRDPEPPSTYAYASDTMPCRSVREAVAGVDLLYHEATYGDDKVSQAHGRGHSTAREAGRIAREVGAKQLVIGHFSKAYNNNEQVLIDQAREEYPTAILAYEGLRIKC